MDTFSRLRHYAGISLSLLGALSILALLFTAVFYAELRPEEGELIFGSILLLSILGLGAAFIGWRVSKKYRALAQERFFVCAKCGYELPGFSGPAKIRCSECGCETRGASSFRDKRTLRYRWIDTRFPRLIRLLPRWVVYCALGACAALLIMLATAYFGGANTPSGMDPLFLKIGQGFMILCEILMIAGGILSAVLLFCVPKVMCDIHYLRRILKRQLRTA